MHVLICGSRSWTDAEAIRREVEALPPDAVVIHGAAPGADIRSTSWGPALSFALVPATLHQVPARCT